MRISDWSSDVCSSDLNPGLATGGPPPFDFSQLPLMALNEQDVARIARLARIELTPDQRSRAQDELNGILHLIERLQAADTQGIEPLAHPLSAHQDIALDRTSTRLNSRH